ncbi:hypothetical protein Y032_0047g1453 [Ancylostoma ceylanicum]|nr:hypothetical protein Y032_0047g1453 [Ancylostoma ceylanicum]
MNFSPRPRAENAGAGGAAMLLLTSSKSMCWTIGVDEPEMGQPAKKRPDGAAAALDAVARERKRDQRRARMMDKVEFVKNMVSPSPKSETLHQISDSYAFPKWTVTLRQVGL